MKVSHTLNSLIVTEIRCGIYIFLSMGWNWIYDLTISLLSIPDLVLNCTHNAAKFMGVKSPIPYRWRKLGVKYLKYGMNFAHGGTGVFNTFVADPNMTTQIDFFQELIKTNVFNASNIESSVALVTLAGNDYSAYNFRNGSAQVRTMHTFTYKIMWLIAIILDKLAVSTVGKLYILLNS